MTPMRSEPGNRRIPRSANVPFIFGVLDAVALPGTILVRLLVDAGMSEYAAKTQLARMKRDGAVTVERVGRAGVYRLAGPMLRSFEHVGRGPRPRSWDGKFRTIVFDIPESHRAVKDQLRSAAAALGYGMLRPGVLISPHDRPMPAIPCPDGFVETGLLELSASASRAAASRAWNLAERSEAFAAQHRTVTRLLDPSAVPSEPAAAFRAFHDHYLGSIEVRVHDPDLPTDLLPDDWMAVPLDRALRRLLELWSPTVTAHTDAVIAASAHRHLVEIRRDGPTAGRACADGTS